MRALLLVALGGAVWAQQPPNDVLDFFRSAADALVNQDSRTFLDHFDPNMPGYLSLENDIKALENADVSSTIEFVSDTGDDKARELQIDWLLRVNGGQPRRQIIQCSIRKQGKKWKITSFKPVDFFAQPSQ
jgi:hypothetical protein